MVYVVPAHKILRTMYIIFKYYILWNKYEERNIFGHLGSKPFGCENSKFFFYRNVKCITTKVTYSLEKLGEYICFKTRLTARLSVLN